MPESDPHISSQIANWAQLGLAILAGLLFLGNETRSWFTQDGLSLTRVAAMVGFKFFGSWPAKIEFFGMDGEAALFRFKVRTPHPLQFQDMRIGLPDAPPVFVRAEPKWDTIREHTTHVVPVSLGMMKTEGLEVSDTSEIYVYAVASGRQISAGPFQLNRSRTLHQGTWVDRVLRRLDVRKDQVLTTGFLLAVAPTVTLTIFALNGDLTPGVALGAVAGVFIGVGLVLSPSLIRRSHRLLRQRRKLAEESEPSQEDRHV